MARPKVKHDGFLIPNAGDVSDPKMAEPDRIDFNTVGNDRWGVIAGCLVTMAGTTASTLGGIAVINGELKEVYPSTVPIAVAENQDRFDLVTVNLDGKLALVDGAPAADPVFPDPPLDQTVLAAVFCPTGEKNLVNNIIDKRNWLADSLLTRLDETKPLIRNMNGAGNHYLVNGDGRTTWNNDTSLYRSAAQTLKVSRHLDVDGDLVVHEDITAREITATADTTGHNLLKAPLEQRPATGSNGDLFQDENQGKLYIWTENHWEELATISNSIPVGSIIQSVEPPSVMRDLGWMPLDGKTVTRTEAPDLFGLTALQRFISPTDNNVMNLPDATSRVMITDWHQNPLKDGGSSAVNLVSDNIPTHDHGISMDPGGAHGHPMTHELKGGHAHTTWVGTHGHHVSDGGHAHNGFDYWGQPASVVVAAWGGKNKLDALFNDKSHTYSVELAHWTWASATGVQVQGGGSEHSHTMSAEGAHTHNDSVDSVEGHTHPLTVQSFGKGTSFQIQPQYLTTYTYIRS